MNPLNSLQQTFHVTKPAEIKNLIGKSDAHGLKNWAALTTQRIKHFFLHGFKWVNEGKLKQFITQQKSQYKELKHKDLPSDIDKINQFVALFKDTKLEQYAQNVFEIKPALQEEAKMGEREKPPEQKGKDLPFEKEVPKQMNESDSSNPNLVKEHKFSAFQKKLREAIEQAKSNTPSQSTSNSSKPNIMETDKLASFAKLLRETVEEMKKEIYQPSSQPNSTKDNLSSLSKSLADAFEELDGEEEMKKKAHQPSSQPNSTKPNTEEGDNLYSLSKSLIDALEELGEAEKEMKKKAHQPSSQLKPQPTPSDKEPRIKEVTDDEAVQMQKGRTQKVLDPEPSKKASKPKKKPPKPTPIPYKGNVVIEEISDAEAQKIEEERTKKGLNTPPPKPPKILD